VIGAVSATENHVFALPGCIPLERDWVPGRWAAYQARSGWQILGEIVGVVSGLAPEAYAARHVLRPVGMEQTRLWADDKVVLAVGDHLAPLADTSGAEPVAPDEVTAPYCSPRVGECGTVDDLRRFYEMLLSGGWGEDVDPAYCCQRRWRP